MKIEEVRYGENGREEGRMRNPRYAGTALCDRTRNIPPISVGYEGRLASVVILIGTLRNRRLHREDGVAEPQGKANEDRR